MNEQSLRQKFPNASDQFIMANLDKDKSAGKVAKLECRPGNEPLAKNKAKKKDTRSYAVCITSIRKRLLDEDNLCSKWQTDALRYAGLISSDAAGKTTITTRQRKCEKGEEEFIIIEINFL